MSGRPFPKHDIRKAMAARLADAAPGLSEDERAAAVRAFDDDMTAIVENWERPYDDAPHGHGALERAADRLVDPPG